MVCTFTLAFFGAMPAQAGPFTPGNLVVVQVGTGGIVVPGDSAPVFIQEFSSTGAGQTTPVNTVELPIAPSGANFALTLSQTTVTEGNLFGSPDQRWIALAGYNAAPGTPGVSTTPSGTVARVVARVDQFGQVDTSTRITDGYNGSPIRGAATDNGTRFWTAGGSPTDGATGGTRFVNLGSSGASTQISTIPQATRAVGIHNGQLYNTAESPGFTAVNRVGTGLPTTPATTTVLDPAMLISGIGAPSPNAFAFSPDGNTLYVADSRSVANGGGVQKWVFNGTNWVLNRTFNELLTTGTFGLAVNFSGPNATIFTVTTETSGNRILSVEDPNNSEILAPFKLVATAGANRVFRGITFAPVPEPGTLLLAGAVGAGFVAFRLRRRKAS
jgi:hypothetical protein